MCVSCGEGCGEHVWRCARTENSGFSGGFISVVLFSLFFSSLLWMPNKRLNSEGRRVCLNPTGGGGLGKTSTAGTRTYSKAQKGVLSSILGAGEVGQRGY